MALILILSQNVRNGQWYLSTQIGRERYFRKGEAELFERHPSYFGIDLAAKREAIKEAERMGFLVAEK